MGGRVGNDALERIATQAKERPLLTLAVAIGIGVLIGAAGRRSMYRQTRRNLRQGLSPSY